MPSRLKISLPSLILFLFLSNAYAQIPPYGQLTITVKQNKEYPMFWNRMTVENKDINMQFDIDGSGRIFIDSLATGKCTLTLYSIFNRSVVQLINVQKNSFTKFNVSGYYEPFNDTGSLLNKMALDDTSYIYYLSGGKVPPAESYFLLVRDKMTDKIVIKNEKGEWISKVLTDAEFFELLKLGKYVKSDDTEGSETYYCIFGNKILIGNCGSCIKGLLLNIN